MGSDLFAPESAPMLPFEFPVAEHDGRIRKIRSPRYVDYEAGNAVLCRLAWLYNHPRVVRPPCSLIYADTNNGKTALAYKFVRDCSPREDSPEYGKRPVVYVHAPPFADLNGT
ncbi:MAG TPA: TniB family NTP-binding protein [Azospirillum sp.]|nr:TniB family NTP-binding protein [Azospirillum sp.]